MCFCVAGGGGFGVRGLACWAGWAGLASRYLFTPSLMSENLGRHETKISRFCAFDGMLAETGSDHLVVKQISRALI